MEDFYGKKNVAEKEEGELSSDDDDDNQPDNIPDSSHSVQNVKGCKDIQVNLCSARSKRITSGPSRITHKDENHRECNKSPQGLKRHNSTSHYENQPLSKYLKQASPGQNEFDPDDVMNGYYSSCESMPDDLRCVIDREAPESENHRSFEKASKPIKRRSTVSGDLRHRLTKHRSAAEKLPSSRRSHTRSWVKSSSGKEFYLSKYNKLWDQRKPPVKPEYKYQGLQIQVRDRGRQEVERKVKERPFHQPLEKRHESNHSSHLEGRFTERQKEVLHSSNLLVTSPQMYDNEVDSNYPQQHSNYLPAPISPHRTLAFRRNPTLPIHQSNGYITFPPSSHAKLDQYLPVALPTTSLQIIPQNEILSDVIGQQLHSMRNVESLQVYHQNAIFSGNTHNYYSASALNSLQMMPEDTASNCSSSTMLRVESGSSTSIFNSKRLGPEVKNDLFDIQPGLNQRESTNERSETTAPRPVSERESDRKLNENQTKTKTEQEKEKLKKYMSELEERNQRMREQVFKEIKNNYNFSYPRAPAAVLHTQFKIDKTPKAKPKSWFKIDRTSKVKPESEFRTSSWTAVPDVSAQNANSCNDTLEQKEEIHPQDSGLPQIDDEITADANSVSSPSDFQSKFTEPQEELKANETYRRRVFVSPLNMFETYRDKQVSTKGITVTRDKSHVMSLAETREKEACNRQASSLEIVETHDEGDAMSSASNLHGACTTQAKEITKTHDEDNMISLAADLRGTKEITDSYDEDNMISFAVDSNKQDSAKEKTEIQEGETCHKQASSLENSKTHYMVSSGETQEKEACNNQVFAVEISEIYKDNVISSTGDSNRHASAKEITETHNENHVFSPAEAWETCNKQVSSLESIEIHEMSPAADLRGACTTQAKEITKTHIEDNMMSSAADLHGACITQAKEITESHDEDNMMGSAADSEKQASAKENTEAHDEDCVMSPVETHEEETCNSEALVSTDIHEDEACNNPALESTDIHDDEACNNPALESTDILDNEACNNPALESTKIHDKRPVVSSVTETQVYNKQYSDMESIETHESHAMSTPEAKKEEACNEHVSALVMNETINEDGGMSYTADIEEDGHNAMEITETYDDSDVGSCSETQEAGNSHVSAIGISETQENGMCSAAGGNNLDVDREDCETCNESHVINLEEKHKEGTCDKHVYTCVVSEICEEECVVSSVEDGQKEHMKINDTHDGGYVMSPAETRDEGATEIIKAQIESDVMSFTSDLQGVCNKNVSAEEITDTHEENDVMCAAEIEEEVKSIMSVVC